MGVRLLRMLVREGVITGVAALWADGFKLARCSPQDVFVVEDHAGLRLRIVNYINDLEGFRVVGDAGSAEAALEDANLRCADIVMTDLRMPGMSGIELIEVLRARYPQQLVILLTGHPDRFYAKRAFQAGANAYLLKDDPEMIRAVIKRLLNGETNVMMVVD